MSYCVNCGVELGEGLKCCPLCNTPVINPNKPDCPEPGQPFFPTRREEVQPVSKKELALLLSAMLASVSLCCALLNLVLRPDLIWSLYAAGGAAMLWIWFVLPLFWRALPGWPRLAMDIFAFALYVLLIALASGGMDWYLRLAMPVIVSAALICLFISYFMRGGRRSILGSVLLVLLGIGMMCLTTELITDLFLRGRWSPDWSLVVLAVLLGLAIPLLIVRLQPSLREEVRRRFHM